jgi:hypothetical protein
MHMQILDIAQRRATELEAAQREHAAAAAATAAATSDVGFGGTPDLPTQLFFPKLPAAAAPQSTSPTKRAPGARPGAPPTPAPASEEPAQKRARGATVDASADSEMEKFQAVLTDLRESSFKASKVLKPSSISTLLKAITRKCAILAKRKAPDSSMLDHVRAHGCT